MPSTLTEFLLARIAEDEDWATKHGFFGDGTAPEWVPPWWTRVSAEAKAKRRIVGVCDDHEEPSPTVLRLLALPYADHPDYDEAWRA